LVDIIVTDENLHAAFLFDRAFDGPDGQGARATGARICTIRVLMAPVRTNVDVWNCAYRWAPWLPIGETETSVRRRFFGQLFGQVSLVLVYGRAGDKEQ